MSQVTKRLLLSLSAALVLPSTTAFADDAACLDAVARGQRLNATHRFVEAREWLRMCTSSACPPVVQTDCASWLAMVEKSLPTVVVLASDGAGESLVDVKVTVDGLLFTAKLDGQALPINPGSHTFHFEGPGGTTADQVVVVPEGEQNHRVAAVMKKPEAAPEPIVTPAPPAPTPPAPTAPPSTPPVTPAEQLNTSESSAPPAAPPPTGHSGRGTGLQRTLAVAAGGIGIVGLGVGAAFAFSAMSQRNDAQSVCPGPTCPTLDGSNKWHTAVISGNASTIGFLVGGVGIAAAAVLLATAPRASAPRAQVGLGVGGVEVSGTW
jgi:hypothetical protein